ncbi:hypothetical protein ETD86_13010 [Nonomuraea turkmeniaca]|uniref:DUF3168 domain-containing protein n=1 Tax=Nonomuraea turkmeniaca TaxID=103838 RepID=A0A5S4FN16_9ACTN|nr:hypothetical protein [Nonomuraea turkmeniaca]TMR22082.1 hypothetical protein ETD86_13010 [Nonomuraea turkmeniaca]
MSHIADADPIPAAIAHLSADPELTAKLGGPGRVGAAHRPPYPRLRVRPAVGGTEDLRTHRVGVPLRLEALDSLERPVGEERLKRIIHLALAVLAALPEIPLEPGEPIITEVTSSGGGPVPEADGRLRWIGNALIAAHPG